MSTPSPEPQPARRNFLKGAAAIAIGTVIGAVPVATGVAVFLDPLRHKSEAGKFVQVANLKDLPFEGVPRRFVVKAARFDVWNRYETAVGAVYLTRTGRTVTAHNVICPHAGCAVDFMDRLPETSNAPATPDNSPVPGFFCPCHNSSFGVNGKRHPGSPAPRSLDQLEVRLEGNNILVKFQNYETGTEKQIPLS